MLLKPFSWHRYQRWALRWALLPIAVWLALLIAVLYLPIPLYSGQFNDDPDNYMRADQVRDWLDGSHDWFDTVQRRIDPPVSGLADGKTGGADVFSRLVDLPLAGVALLAKPYLGLGGGIELAAFIVPFVLLLPLFLFTVGWAFRPLFGSAAWLLAGLAIAYPGVGAEFMPGRIDHHNVQILLFTASLGVTLRLLLVPSSGLQIRDRAARWGMALGLLLALSLAVGVEALPWLGLLLAALGAALWQTPQRLCRAAFAFAGTAPLAMAVLLFALRTPSQMQQPTLHTVSLLSLVLVCAIALVFALAAWTAPRVADLKFRAAALAIIVIAVGGVLLLLEPILLQGPFAGFDPWLVAFTKTRVGEMQPLARYAELWPWVEGLIALSSFGYWRLWQTRSLQRHIFWLLTGLATLSGVLALFYAARLDRFWFITALPGLFATLAFGKTILGQMIERKPQLVILGSLLLAFAPVGLLLWNSHQPVRHNEVEAWLQPRCELCIAADYLNLNFFTPQRILAYGTIAPELIWRTPHSIIGGGIYNNGMGLKAARHFFVLTEPAQAAEILRVWAIDLVYVRDLPYAASVLANQTDDDYDRPLHANDPKAMIQRLQRGERFSWLNELSVPFNDGKFTIYKVYKANLPGPR